MTNEPSAMNTDDLIYTLGQLEYKRGYCHGRMESFPANSEALLNRVMKELLKRVRTNPDGYSKSDGVR